MKRTRKSSCLAECGKMFLFYSLSTYLSIFTYNFFVVNFYSTDNIRPPKKIYIYKKVCFTLLYVAVSKFKNYSNFFVSSFFFSSCRNRIIRRLYTQNFSFFFLKRKKNGVANASYVFKCLMVHLKDILFFILYVYIHFFGV